MSIFCNWIDDYSKSAFYEDKFVAFIDLMGYSAYIEKSNAPSEIVLPNLIVDLQEESSNLYKDGQLNIVTFPDSMIIVSSKEYVDNMFKFIASVYNLLLTNGFLLRGGIAYGAVYYAPLTKSVTGQALVTAQNIESKLAKYPCICLDDNALKHLDNKNYIKKDVNNSWLDWVKVYKDLCKEECGGDVWSGIISNWKKGIEIAESKIEKYDCKIKIYVNWIKKYIFYQFNNTKEPVISVIVPVYNAEKYLSKCLDSVCNQSLKEIEVILINNASTDNSLKICENFAEKDKRITILNSSINLGPQGARNIGINYASGKYIAFVDSDDWIDNDLFFKLLNKELNNDIIIFGGIFEYGKTTANRKIQLKEGVYEKEDEISNILSNMMYSSEHNNSLIYGCLWDKIYKKNILLQILPYTSEECLHGEDMILVYQYMLLCKKISIVHQYGYHYRIHNTSTVHSLHVEFIKDIGIVYEYLYRCFEKHSLRDNLLISLQKNILTSLYSGLSSEVMGFYDELKPVTYLLPDIDYNNKKIVLYAAGRVGQDYYRQLKKIECCDVVLWIDNNYEAKQEQGYDVHSVEEILGLEYDIVLIATARENMSKSIIGDLKNMGVSANKIIWEMPKSIING